MNTLTRAMAQTEKLLSKHQISRVILGFSGGPDSVFLAVVLKQLRFEGLIQSLNLAYFDYGLVTKDGKKGGDFCQEFALRYQLKLDVKKLSSVSSAYPNCGSLEARYRAMRRDFFQTLKVKYNANAIALAHHSDDQIETFFVRLMRGSSIYGLGGMLELKDGYIRPLLGFSKADIVTCLQSYEINFLQDPTNEQDIYLRNRIRQEVMPACQKVDTRFQSSALKTMQQLQRQGNLLQELLEQKIADLARENNQYCLTSFLSMPSLLQQEVVFFLCLQQHILGWTPSSAQIMEMLRFMANPGGGKHKVGPVTITKAKNMFTIQPAIIAN